MANFLFDQSPHEAALDLIILALEDELRSTPHIQPLAENLQAIAIHYDVPIEDLLHWIREPAIGKRWTASEFRRWCEATQPIRDAERARQQQHPNL